MIETDQKCQQLFVLDNQVGIEGTFGGVCTKLD